MGTSSTIEGAIYFVKCGGGGGGGGGGDDRKKQQGGGGVGGLASGLEIKFPHSAKTMQGITLKRETAKRLPDKDLRQHLRQGWVVHLF